MDWEFNLRLVTAQLPHSIKADATTHTATLSEASGWSSKVVQCAQLRGRLGDIPRVCPPNLPSKLALQICSVMMLAQTHAHTMKVSQTMPGAKVRRPGITWMENLLDGSFVRATVCHISNQMLIFFLHGHI